MHCRICGKEILDDAFCEDVCLNCADSIDVQSESSDKDGNIDTKTAQTDTINAVETQEEAESVKISEPTEAQLPCKPIMRGFGKALAGAIVGTVGVGIAALSSYYALIGIMGAEFWVIGVMMVSMFLVPSIVSTLISLVFGIKSIVTYCKADGKKPIPALVLGIYSLLCSGGLLLLIPLSLVLTVIGFLMVALI